MGSLAIPERLADGMRRDPGVRAWVADLGDRIVAVRDHWSLDVEMPFEPGGRTAWVAPARTAHGDDVVVKVGFAHPEAAHEAAGLRWWAGDGAIELIDAFELGADGGSGFDTTALLLERCRPGTTLAAATDEANQDEVIAGLLRRLWAVEPPAGHVPTLQSMCDQWADQFERASRTRPVELDPGIARAGIALLRELPGTAPRSALLCTDLHAENVLASQRQPWLVVDPKPHVGDPAYDVVQHLLNCPTRLHADPVALCRRLADLTGVDGDRVSAWLFARCVQESPHWPGTAEVARQLAP